MSRLRYDYRGFHAQRFQAMQFPSKEDILVEFKAVPKAGLPDRVVLDAIVGFANASGGTLYIGIDDSGTVTGIPADCPKWLDPWRIEAFALERTMPPVQVHSEIVVTDEGLSVAVIRIPPCDFIVSANDGRVVRRRIKGDGTLENMPVHPIEHPTELESRRHQDLTSRTVSRSTLQDLNPQERDFLRETIRTNRGYEALLELDDEAFDRALGIVARDKDGVWRPTYAGLLLIGHRAAIERFVPGHRVIFQVLNDDWSKRIEEEMDLPIATGIRQLINAVNAVNYETELESGPFRVGLKDFDVRAVREAVVNAYCHRDYGRNEPILVQAFDDELRISNPGGFKPDVSYEKILSAAPPGRNPHLASALMRIGLVERTGRGLVRIYEGSVRMGRVWPRYGGSTDARVEVRISREKPDPAFKFFIDDLEEKRGKRFKLLQLMLIQELRKRPKTTFEKLLDRFPFPGDLVDQEIELMTKEGFIVEEDENSCRLSEVFQSILLKPPVSAERSPSGVRDALKTAQPEGEKPRTPAEREGVLLDAFVRRPSVTRADVAGLLDCSPQTAYRLLNGMTEKGLLRAVGEGRNRRYERNV